MHGVEPLFELFEQQRYDYRVRHVGQALHVVVAVPPTPATSAEAVGRQFQKVLQLHGGVRLQPAYSFLRDDRGPRHTADLVLEGHTGDHELVIIVEMKASSAGALGRASTEYDDDFVGWAQAQAHAIRERHWDVVDTENLAEEIEDLSKSGHRELRSRLRVLVMHRLKWDVQPEQRSRSWIATMREQQAQIEDLLKDSPSLRTLVDAYARDGYEAARDLAAAETGLTPDRFPAALPYTGTQLLLARLALPEDA